MLGKGLSELLSIAALPFFPLVITTTFLATFAEVVGIISVVFFIEPGEAVLSEEVRASVFPAFDSDLLFAGSLISFTATPLLVAPSLPTDFFKS